MKKITSVTNRMMEMCMHCCMCMSACAPEAHMFSISKEKHHAV